MKKIILIILTVFLFCSDYDNGEKCNEGNLRENDNVKQICNDGKWRDIIIDIEFPNINIESLGFEFPENEEGL